MSWMPSSFRLKELKVESNAGKDEKREARLFSLQPTPMACRNVLTVAPETRHGVLELEIRAYLKCMVSLAVCFQCSLALLPSHSNLLFPPLSRLLVFRRPVPGAGKTLCGCYRQALGEAAGPRYHWRLQGIKTRQLPSCLAHTIQWKGCGTAFHL